MSKKRDYSKTDCPILLAVAMLLRALGKEVKAKETKCRTMQCAVFDEFNQRCRLGL